VNLILSWPRDEHTLLELRNLAEPVHVQLADEASKLVVLEPLAQDLAPKPLRVDDCWRILDRTYG
jgi:hypothetical protein